MHRHLQRGKSPKSAQSKTVLLTHNTWVLKIIDPRLCVRACVRARSVSQSVMSDSLRLHELWPARVLCPWNFPAKNTGVGCYSRGSSWPRDQTLISSFFCIGRRIRFHWATREALGYMYSISWFSPK